VVDLQLDDTGETALMLSVKKPNHTIVKWLIRNNADLFMKDFNAKTAFSKTAGQAVQRKLANYERQFCGLSNQAKITDWKKQSSLPGQVYHPWQAFVKGASNKMCGGIIINKNWILTVAHCLHECSSENATECDNLVETNDRPFEVVLGTADALENNKGHAVSKTVISAVVHPGFTCRCRSGAFLHNNDDLILLRVEDIEFNSHVRPACLGSPSFANSLYKHRKSCFTPEWVRKQLKYQSAQRISSNNCLNEIRESEKPDFMSLVSDNHCFEAPKAEREACQNEIGNPAVCVSELGNVAVVGLNADVIQQDDECRHAQSHLFLDTSTYMDWINDNAERVYIINEVDN